MDKVWCAFDRVKQEGGKVLTILRKFEQLVLGAVLLRNPQVHPRLCFPASSTSGLRAGNPSLFLCFEQVCTKVFFAFLASAERGWALRKSTTDFGKINHIFGKSVTSFGKICLRFWGNPSKSVTDSATGFGEICHRLWGNPLPILGKSVTDFGKIRHGFWGNPSPILGKSATDFGTISHRFWGNQPPTLGKNWLCFRERLARF